MSNKPLQAGRMVRPRMRAPATWPGSTCSHVPTIAAPVSGFATALAVESCTVSRLIVASSSSRCSAEAFAVLS